MYLINRVKRKAVVTRSAALTRTAASTYPRTYPGRLGDRYSGLIRKTCGAVSRTRLNSSRDKSLISNDCWRPFRPRDLSPKHRGEPLCFVREGFQPKRAALACLTTRIKICRCHPHPFNPSSRIFGLRMTALLGAALRACIFSERLKLMEGAPGDNRQIGDCSNRGAASS